MNAFLFPALLPLGLLVPGWLMGRALGTRAGFIGAFLGSAALLMNSVVLLDAAGMQITLATLLLALGVICGALILVWLRHRPTGGAIPSVGDPGSVHAAADRWLMLPVALGLLAIGMKVWIEPLSGYDNGFRWEFLARQIFRHHTLGFYPPITASDFLQYGWCDGIAPLISSLYLWSYLSLGKIAAVATTPVVVMTALLLFRTVFELAALTSGPRAGRAAVAVLATSAVLLWGVAMGQETGMTALALIAMFAFIDKHRAQPDARWLVWAGIAAGVGALAREYGLVYVALGGITLAWQREKRRGWCEFITAAAITAMPWYLRNWAKAGNPLYCHDLAGIFPVNPVHLDHFRSIQALSAIGTGVQWPALAAAIFGLAGLSIGLGLAVGILHWKSRTPWVAAMLTVLALWLWSIPQTAGGWVYSLRVLTPAIALGAVLGGTQIARMASTRWIYAFGAICTVLAIDAGERSLFLPIDPAVKWWTEPPFAWHEFSRLAARWTARPIWDQIAEAAAERGVLATDPVVQVQLIEHGVRAVPIFSPAVQFLFDPAADFGPCLTRLRTLQIRFVLLTQENPFNRHHFMRYPFWRALNAAKPLTLMKPYAIYDLWSPDLIAVSSASAPLTR